MTPEERLDRIEATLERAAKLQEKTNLRHAGIRTLYRQGVNRLEEMMDRMDRQDALIEALIDSQLRTEQGLQRLEKTVEDLASTVKLFIESQTRNGK